MPLLGAGWDLAKVRGTRFNTGMSENGARHGAGRWATGRAATRSPGPQAPEFGDSQGRGFQSLLPGAVYLTGRQALRDEARLRQLPDASMGGCLLAARAFAGRFRRKVNAQRATRPDTAVTMSRRIRGGARRQDGLPEEPLSMSCTLTRAVQTNIPFNPNVKEGRGTRNLKINKSNWRIRSYAAYEAMR